MTEKAGVMIYLPSKIKIKIDLYLEKHPEYDNRNQAVKALLNAVLTKKGENEK